MFVDPDARNAVSLLFPVILVVSACRSWLRRTLPGRRIRRRFLETISGT